jgi:hypothetical protein
MTIIGVVGSRRRVSIKDYKIVTKAIAKHFQPGDHLVSGGCPKGADAFAEIFAKVEGLTITIHYPNWKKHGKAAGIIRNTAIAMDCDVLIACVAPDRTGGTEDTIRKAKKLGKTVILV